jgi:predicted alpha/beta hydrolase family esterase
MSKQVLFLHGWTNRRPEGNWQRLAAVALRQQGHQVHYPQLPSPDQPRFADWAEVALNELAQIAESNRGEEVIVIGHSLGAVTWLKLVSEGLAPSLVSRVLLVAPADPELLIDIPDFILDVAAAAAAVRSAADTVVVGSDEDPWQPNGIEATFSTPLDVPVVVVPGARHFSLSDGYGEWAGVINWVNDPASDLSVR